MGERKRIRQGNAVLPKDMRKVLDEAHRHEAGQHANMAGDIAKSYEFVHECHILVLHHYLR
jgi:hypothetical protein